MDTSFRTFEARIARLENLVSKLTDPRDALEARVEELLKAGTRPVDVVRQLAGTAPRTSPATLYRVCKRVAPRLK